jgi:hypothetical protein
MHGSGALLCRVAATQANDTMTCRDRVLDEVATDEPARASDE